MTLFSLFHTVYLFLEEYSRWEAQGGNYPTVTAFSHCVPIPLGSGCTFQEYPRVLLITPTSFPGVIDLATPFFPSMPCSIITPGSVTQKISKYK